MADKLAPEKRHSFVHNGQNVFEWDQTLEDVNMYINLPPNVPPKQFYCKIESKHVEVGIKGNPPYLNHDLSSPVKTDSSFWTIEDDILHITLQKRDKGQTWASPIWGRVCWTLTPLILSKSGSCFRDFRKRIWHKNPYTLGQPVVTEMSLFVQNPGFDFSQAQFTGNCPNPRTFMGGIRTD